VHVLILHQHFNTPQKGGALRSYYLATALVNHGYKVTVISGHNGKEVVQENVEGIDVHYLPIAYDNRFGFTARSISFLKYVWKAGTLTGKLKKFDVCYAISVPLTVGITAMWLKRKHKIPFLFEVGDLWPDAPIQMGFIKNYLFTEILYSLERKIYRSAKAVVALSPAIQTAVEKKVPGKKVHLIPNMADCDFYRPEEKNPLLEKKYQVKEKFVVSYIGALGIANGLDYILECARASQKAALDIHFFICGDGAMLDHLTHTHNQLALKNLTILPFQDRAGVKELMNVTDAAFVCYKLVSILETGSPNKFFDALAGGKLVITNFSGWIREEIEREGCGVSSDSFQPTDFVEKITPFLNDRNKLKEAQRAARALGEKKYSREVLSKKFAALFSTRSL